jgi:hypothetical protein
VMLLHLYVVPDTVVDLVTVIVCCCSFDLLHWCSDIVIIDMTIVIVVPRNCCIVTWL